MQPSSINRRSFLGYLLISAAFVRCRKDLGPGSKPVKPFQPITTPLSVDAQAKYTITEAGANLQANPDFMNGFNGYCSQLSFLPGATADLFFSGPSNDSASIVLKDMRGTTILTQTAAVKPQPVNSQKPWAEGFKYDKTLSVQIPENLDSGIYLWNDTVPMIVKGSSELAYDLTVVYNSNTIHAYNYAGGKSLYAPDFANRATVVSFLRSHTIASLAFFQWLAHQNYKVNYIADTDLDDYSMLQNSKALVITGHSEYWTRDARTNIDKYLETGKNVLMLSGNNMWWQVRYNKTKDLMICYKSTTGAQYDHNTLDPLAGTIYSTINYGSNLDYGITSTLGADYRWGGYGQTLANRWDGYKIVQENSPILKGSGLKNGDIMHMPTTEYDGTPVVTLFGQETNATPVIDNSVLNFYKVELIGFDYAQNLTRKDRFGFGTFMVCQKTATSGTIINTATMDWCLNFGDGRCTSVRTITKNMIDLSLSDQSAFTS